MAKWVQPSPSTVQAWLERCVDQPMLVVGDLMLDAYVIGKIDRISPEAPVPVLSVQREQCMLGGAANVAKALVALGAKVSLAGVVGDDADGRLLRAEAEQLGINVDAVVRDPSRPTTRKTRIVAQRQQVIRLDHEVATPLDAVVQKQLIARITKAARRSRGVVLSDYAKGVLTPAVATATITAAGAAPTVVDPKDPPWTHYRGATVLKPNLVETLACTQIQIDDAAQAARAARRLLGRLKVQSVLLTRGRDGMTLVQRRGKATVTDHLPARQREVFDVTGAGDMVAGVLALALAGGVDLRDATWLANVAAGIKVGKFGAATVTGQEILEHLHDDDADLRRKILTPAQAASLARDLRRRGRRVVFTNGCFDILHVGHVQYLQQSRQQGDVLIVGLNTDASVGRLKGPGRPVQSEMDRATILAAQACVDAVVLFDEPTPIGLIKAIAPDVLTKGADYRRKQDIVGWDIVEKRGGQVVRIDLVAGRSTTDLIARTRDGKA